MQSQNPSAPPSPAPLPNSPHPDLTPRLHQIDRAEPIAAVVPNSDHVVGHIMADQQADQFEREHYSHHIEKAGLGGNVEQSVAVEDPNEIYQAEYIEEVDQVDEIEQVAPVDNVDQMENVGPVFGQPGVADDQEQPPAGISTDAPEAIIESTYAAITRILPNPMPVTTRFSMFPPVIFTTTQNSQFETKAMISRVLEETWDLCKERCLDRICYSHQENPLLGFNSLDNRYVREAVVALVHICTSWRCEEDPSFKVGKFFYDRLKNYITTVCEKYCRQIMKKGNLPMLKKAAELTEKYFNNTSFMSAFFLVLDQTHVQSSDVPNVRTMLGECYRSGIFSRVKQRIHTVVCVCLESWRAGFKKSYLPTINSYKSLMGRIAESVDPYIVKEWNDFLLNNCCNLLLSYLETGRARCICGYIRLLHKRVQDLRGFGIGIDLVPIFLIFFLGRLNNSVFFTPQTRQEHIDGDERSTTPPVIHLLEMQRSKPLKRLFRIFGTESDFMERVANLFEEHLETKVIPELNETAENEALGFELFSKFIQTWARVARLAETARAAHGGSAVFAHALENPFKPFVRQHAQLFKVQLESYLDKLISRTKFKNRILPEKSLTDETWTVVSMLRFLPRLDVFLEEYKRKLARRILREDIPPKKVEAILAAMVKEFVHLEEVENLKGVLSIVTKKAENTKAFTHSAIHAFLHSSKVRLSRAKAVRGIDWPEEMNLLMKLPDQMRNTVEYYNTFIKAKHQEKTLAFNFSSDSVIVNSSVFGRGWRKAKFHMSTNQMCILNLFQMVDGLTITEILEKVRQDQNGQVDSIDEDVFNEKVRMCLRSLMTEQCPLLKKNPDSEALQNQDLIYLNYGFRAKNALTVLPVL